MIEEVKKFGLSVVENVQDLGYFGWTPVGPSKKLHEVTAEDLRKGTNFLAEPHLVQPVEVLQTKCPTKFKKERLKRNNHHNAYPHNPSYLVPLYVAATNRGIDIDSIDFLFGGSILHMLATANINNGVEYYAQKVPGTNVVVVEKKQSYTTNWNTFGYAFERFVREKSNTATTVMHLQVLTLGGYRVLFAAETDGMDQDGHPVEITTTKKQNWGIRVALQMISNGSHSLYAGTQNQNSLETIDRLSLSKVLDKAFHQKNKQMEVNTNIVNGIQALVRASDRLETPHTIHFEGKRLICHPLSSFPTKEETLKLLMVPRSTGLVGPSQDVASRDAALDIDGISNRIREGRLSERDYDFLESLPEEIAIGYGYTPDEFMGFDSD